MNARGALRVGLAPGVRSIPSTGRIRLERGGVELGWPEDTPAALSVVGLLPSFPTLEELEEGAERDGWPLSRLYFLLERLTRHRLLELRLGSEEGPKARLCPAPAGWWHGKSVEPQRYRLSRFAWLRLGQQGHLLLESARSRVVSTLDPAAAAALLGESAEPDSPGGGFRRRLVSLLAGERVFVPEGDESETEARADSLLLWEFHDLLFHSRSRMGLHSNPYGAVYPFPEVPPLPAVKPSPAADTGVSLPKPDLQKLRSSDPTLTRVLESRHSVRDYGSPLQLARLGEFLYRTARVRHRIQARKQELTSRPYPGGGACHPLELYLAVRTCEGLAPGLYHYCPERHLLFSAEAEPDPVRRLLQDAQRAMGASQPPQVLIVLAARLQRLSWKYRSMAYAAALKEVGVLFQTMYLAATAMGLAACAVGGGNIEVFSRATGLFVEQETSLGEFAIGGLPPGNP